MSITQIYNIFLIVFGAFLIFLFLKVLYDYYLPFFKTEKAFRLNQDQDEAEMMGKKMERLEKYYTLHLDPDKSRGLGPVDNDGVDFADAQEKGSANALKIALKMMEESQWNDQS